MRDDAQMWLAYAEENLACARLVLQNGYFNPCLQNVQQAVEKALKAFILEKGLEFRRTHSTSELNSILAAVGFGVGLTGDECDLLDSIYLPSKYPLGSALPDAEPDAETCNVCIEIAAKVVSNVGQALGV